MVVPDQLRSAHSKLRDGREALHLASKHNMLLQRSSQAQQPKGPQHLWVAVLCPHSAEAQKQEGADQQAKFHGWQVLQVTCVCVAQGCPEAVRLGQIIWVTELSDWDQGRSSPLTQGWKVMHAMPAAQLPLRASGQFLPGLHACYCLICLSVIAGDSCSWLHACNIISGSGVGRICQTCFAGQVPLLLPIQMS